MVKDDADDAARLAFFEVLRASELVVVLAESDGDSESTKLEILETEDGPIALAFDTELRMVEFLGRPAPYALLSGRSLAPVLARQSVALALNLGAPSEYLLQPDVVAWLAETVPPPVDIRDARPASVSPPSDVPEAVLRALDRALARLAGLAPAAFLVTARYEGGREGSLLVLPGAPDASWAGVAEAVAEALHYSGLEAAALDVAFPPYDLSDRFAKVGLKFDIPDAPGRPARNPDAPPRLV